MVNIPFSDTQHGNQQLNIEQTLPFTEVAVPGQKIYDGNVFPLALALPADYPTPDVPASESYLRELAASGKLTRLLRQHGAILL